MECALPRDEATAIPLPADGDLDRISKNIDLELVGFCRRRWLGQQELSVRSPYYVPTRCRAQAGLSPLRQTSQPAAGGCPLPNSRKSSRMMKVKTIPS